MWFARAEETNVKRQEELEAWEAQLSPEALRQYKKDRLQRFRLRAAKKAEALGTTGLKQRGTTAFMLFSQAYRRNPAQFELPVIEPPGKNATVTTAKALGQVWRSMTLGEKAVSKVLRWGSTICSDGLVISALHRSGRRGL